MLTALNLTVRDWMVIIGTLLIVAVFINAWRSMRAERRIRGSVRETGESFDDDELFNHELPSGGARVLRREDLIAAQQQHDAEQREARQETPPQSDSAAAVPAGASPGAPARRGAGARPAAEPLAGVTPRRSEPANLDWLEDLPVDEEPPAAQEPAGGGLPRGDDTQVIMLHVIARDGGEFRGKDILEILLACDLRFGDMDFFHRHEHEAGRGPIQFSVANMLQPGVFDIDHMEQMRTRGLVFFLTLPGPEDMERAFDYMLETARTVARNLGGEMLDESRSVLTQQAVEHARQQVRDLERRLLARGR